MPDTKILTEAAEAFTKKELPESEVELSGEIPAAILHTYEGAALKGLSAELELPGFRKGHVPVEMARKRLGDMAILEEQVELCMRDFYPILVTAQHIDAVGRPQIAITKLVPNTPAGIRARTAVYPTVTLPKHWRTIGAKIPYEPIVDEPEEPETTEQTAEEKAVAAVERAKRKEWEAKEKRRGQLIDALLAQTKVAVPRIFVESELGKIMAQLKEDVSRIGMQLEQYLSKINKTEEQLQDDFRAQATERAKLQVTLNKISEEDHIEADPEAVEHELTHAKEHFPTARPDLLRIHIETVLRNEKILQILEEGEKKE